MNNIPYTYLIGWKSLDLWYYGVRYAKNCCPNDLWVGYFTSSKKVAETRILHGEPDVIKIHKSFPDGDDRIQKAQLFENSMLIRMGVIHKQKWLNGNNSKAFDPTTVPRGDTHWTRQNTKKAKEWRRATWRVGGNQPCGDNHWTKQETTAAKNHKIRMTSNNPNNDLQVKKKKSDYLKKNNPVNLPGVKEKISATLTGTVRPRVSCIICKNEIADVIFKRHHLNKCKYSL